jgi:hypothetical protein
MIRYYCPCGVAFEDEDILILHVETKGRGHSYACAACENLCNTINGLDQHIDSKHPQCSDPECTFYAYDVGEVMAHELEARHFYCEDCDSAFNGQHQLEAHLRGPRHARVVLQRTQVLAIDDIGNLKILLLEESTLECSMCGRTFASRFALRQHKRAISSHAYGLINCPFSDVCPIRFTSSSALLPHIANGECRRSNNIHQSRELAARNVDLSRRYQELQTMLSESKSEYEDSMRREKACQAKYGLKRAKLAKCISELERSAGESQAKCAESMAEIVGLTRRYQELEVCLSKCKAKYEDLVTHSKAKRDLEKIELTQQVLELERALSVSKEESANVAQRASQMEESRSQIEAKSAELAQQLNDITDSTTRKVALLSSEVLRLKDEAIVHDNAAKTQASEFIILKTEIESLRSSHQEALDQLASKAKHEATCPDTDSDQGPGLKHCSSAEEEVIEALEPAKSEVAGASQASAHVESHSISEDTKMRPGSACATVDDVEEVRDHDAESSADFPNLATQPSKMQCHGKRTQHGSHEKRLLELPDFPACTMRYSYTFVSADMVALLRAAGVYTPLTSDAGNFIRKWTFSNEPCGGHSDKLAAICPPTQASCEDDSVRVGANDCRPTSKGTKEGLCVPMGPMSDLTISRVHGLPTPESTPKSSRIKGADDVMKR